MGGCHSHSGTGGEAPPKKLEFSDIAGHKLKNSSSRVSPCCQEKPYLQRAYVSERISGVDMRLLCALPMGVDQAEWIASNTIAFFKHVSLLCGALSEFCTSTSCPVAIGPGPTTYYWTDEQGRKLRCSGPLYADYALSYIQMLLTDERAFPTRADSSFPHGYIYLVQRVFLHLFRVLGHLYWAHYRDVLRLELHPHLNTLFIHLFTFSRHFQLLDVAETAPLEDLACALTVSVTPLH